jgi:hypothetical protein
MPAPPPRSSFDGKLFPVTLVYTANSQPDLERARLQRCHWRVAKSRALAHGATSVRQLKRLRLDSISLRKPGHARSGRADGHVFREIDGRSNGRRPRMAGRDQKSICNIGAVGSGQTVCVSRRNQTSNSSGAANEKGVWKCGKQTTLTTFPHPQLRWRII